MDLNEEDLIIFTKKRNDELLLSVILYKTKKGEYFHVFPDYKEMYQIEPDTSARGFGYNEKTVTGRRRYEKYFDR